MKINNNKVEVLAIIVTIIYIVTNGIISTLFYFLFGDYILNSNPDYLGVLDIFTYLLLLIFILKLNWKRRSKVRKVSKVNYLNLFLVAILFTIVLDPIHRVQNILNIVEFPIVEKSIQRSWYYILINLVSYVLLIPICEEIIFRKIILEKLKSKKGILFSILYSSFAFSLIHINFFSFSIEPIINAFIAGIILALFYFRYGLTVAIVLHALFNLIWLSLKEYKYEYWEIIKKFDFNLVYWMAILVFLLLFIFLSILEYRKIKVQQNES